jgi:hypothetical protein
MKKIFFPIIVFISVFISGCNKDFEVINTNPNNPEVIYPELLMVNIIRGSVNDLVGDGFSSSNVLMQFMTEVRQPGIDRYQIGSTNTWDNGYSNLRNVQNLYDISEERGLVNYKAIAKIMRVLLFSRMTDCYGNLPYKEALQGKKGNNGGSVIYLPKFDSQEEVYAGLIKELKEANMLLDAKKELIKNDILFNGDVLKWKMFANSLCMRLLLRRSNKINPSNDMREMLANPTTYPLMGTVGENAVLKYVEAPNLFPLTSTRSGDIQYVRLSKTFADKLNELQDPRLPIFFLPTPESVTAGSPKYSWVLNGETDVNLGSNIVPKSSQIGTFYYKDIQVPVAAQGLIMLVSELKFILAESVVKGYITGDAKQYYEDGIKASMDYYKSVSGVNISATMTYLNQPGVAYNATKSLELIGTQRWIAMFYNDWQAWHEWKRTGFPVLTPSKVNFNGDRIPVRFIYPSGVQVTNRDNYTIAVTAQGSDDINTKLWWMK